MKVANQKTLKNRISCTGFGLHTGIGVTMTLHPAAPDTGVVFCRSDPLGRGVSVPATVGHVDESAMCTTLRYEDGVKISTIEHLMAALSGCRVDNVVIELDGPEVPIMDGSSAPFVFLIECAGVACQDAPRKAIRVLKPVEVRDGDKTASLAPADGFSVSFEIDFPSPAVAHQSCFVALSNGSFKSEVSRARTFGFIHELEQLLALGLARGGSLDNAVVVSGSRILNDGGLRYDDEFVRHKVLDTIGDLYLLGAPLIGHFHGVRSGHALTHRLVGELLGDDKAWCYTTMPVDGAAAAVAVWPKAASA